MDFLWYAFENKYSHEEIGDIINMTTTEVKDIINGFLCYTKTTEYLRMPPLKYSK